MTTSQSSIIASAEQADVLARAAFDRFWAQHGQAVTGEADRLGIPVDQHVAQRLLRVTGKAGLIGVDDLPDLIVATDIAIDRGAGTCEFRGFHPRLSVTEYDILSLLVCNAELVVSRRFFVDQLWDGHAGYTGNVNVYINRLRDRLQLTATEGPLVTMYGRGYRWRG